MNNLQAWISHTNDGRAIVYLSATKRVGDIPNASQATAGSVFEAFKASFRDFSSGLLSAQVPVNATHLGCVVDGDVDISACLMFLVKAGLKNYWVANFGRFTRLSALWLHIQGCLGYSAGEFHVVHDEYMRAVMANHSNLDALAPQVLVILNDGNPVQVQTFGLPDITKITVVNQLHQDEVTSEDPLDLLRLSFANGQVVESVKDVTPEVQIVKSIKDLAVLA
ncbi:hypothetical protein [Pseudomonas mohnii]